MKKKKIDIIDETVAYYAADPSRRAESEDGECHFLTGDGRMCAFARCCVNPADLPKGSVGSIYDGSEYKRNLQQDLKEEYRGHKLHFWRDIQYMHDQSHIWNASGLTESGLREVKALKEKYANQ